MAKEGSGLLGWIIALFVVIPILIGAGSTFLFCRSVGKAVDSGKKVVLPRAAPDDCPKGSACAASVSVLEAAGRADSAALRSSLAEPAWLDKLPPAATTTPQEKGQWYLRNLLGKPAVSLEELRAAPLEWRIAKARTALDGQSATVTIQFRNLPGQAEIGEATLELKRVGDDWKIAK
ncbi:MAG TPA: hypothetical protein VGK67_24260 [Myxococcales bacterium]